MPTTPDYTTPWGLPKPKGTNLIAGSSDNLRQDLGALADKTNQSLTQVLDQAVERASWHKGDVPADMGLDDLHGPSSDGSYNVSVSTSGNPIGQPGWVEVTYSSISATTRQLFLPSSQNLNYRLVRTHRASQGWSQWVLDSWRALPLTASDDVDQIYNPGVYLISSGTITGSPIGGPGVLEVLDASTADNTVIQRVTAFLERPHVLQRIYTNDQQWTSWRQVSVTAVSHPADVSIDTVTESSILDISNFNTPGLPVQANGVLTTHRAAGYRLQWYVTAEGSPRIYIRRRSNNIWAEWTRLQGGTASPEITNRISSLEVRVTDLESGGSDGPVAPIGEWSPEPLETAPGEYPSGMSQDRMVLYNGNSTTLAQSVDEGETWEQIPGTFGAGQTIEEPEELGNGELLVVSSGSGENDHGAGVWISTGYDKHNPNNTTWSLVESISHRAHRIRFPGSWGRSVYGSIVLLAEYGPKQGQPDVAPGEHARYIYLSTDYGKTWETIFDLDTDVPHDANEQLHVHGVAWDPWWDRIWVTWGDDDDGIAYSDDLGKTWNIAFYWGQPKGGKQSVGIVPMKHCILFGSDDPPNGVFRINRSEGKKATGEYQVDNAYAINDSLTRTHLCHAPYLSHTGIAYFPFGMEDVAGYPCIAATRDGYTWETIWTSDHWTDAGHGVRRVLGPTIRGNLIAYSVDGRYEYPRTVYKSKAPY